MTAAGDDVEKLGKALAAEHAVLFAYGLLGARTSGRLRDRMSAAYDAHRARRDQLRSYITSRGGRPVEPEASYQLPFIPSNATLAADLAVQLEAGGDGGVPGAGRRAGRQAAPLRRARHAGVGHPLLCLPRCSTGGLPRHATAGHSARLASPGRLTALSVVSLLIAAACLVGPVVVRRRTKAALPVA
ncbi:ferritin-like domain-containing protein [Nonomuraea salmonea]|uniref:ferritin-like domain-containing protein n=1 Tax=Nonomuraea salmonea TaxID=46181 RepID=UPI002FEB5C18